MGELVSIIVPIYNVDKYLQKCVQSILNQTYDNIEVILVDDGSKDNSGIICDELSHQDQRIKVVHQKNGGLTVTRRNGVAIAQGDYISFVDGDDWVEPDMIQTLYGYASRYNADIVTSAGIREGGNKQGQILCDSIPKGLYNIHARDTYVLRHLFSASWSSQGNINGAVWNKLFKKHIIQKTLNQMDDNVNGFMDDNVCVIGSILYSDRIYISQTVLYHHRERNDAFTYSNNSNALMQINYAYLSMKKFIEESPYEEILYPLLVEHTSAKLMNAYNVFFDVKQFHIPTYLFSGKNIECGANIIIYGAGEVGKSYAQQFRAENKYNIVAIVDKNVIGTVEGILVSKPCEMKDYIFNYVIIAVLNNTVAEKVKESLINLGIEEKKIVWEKPIPLISYYNTKDKISN